METIKEMIARMCPKGVEMILLSDCCDIQRGKRVVRKDLASNGTIPVFQNSLTPLGYYNQSNCPQGTTFVISAGAAGEIGFCDEPFWAADDCLVISCSELIIDKYAFFYLKTQENYLKSQIRGGAMKRLSKDVLSNLEIPLPPLPIQQEIVRILDTFEATIANLKQEIEARKKQYEYYREQLLTFN